MKPTHESEPKTNTWISKKFFL